MNHLFINSKEDFDICIESENHCPYCINNKCTLDKCKFQTFIDNKKFEDEEKYDIFKAQ